MIDWLKKIINGVSREERGTWELLVKDNRSGKEESFGAYEGTASQALDRCRHYQPYLEFGNTISDNYDLDFNLVCIIKPIPSRSK